MSLIKTYMLRTAVAVLLCAVGASCSHDEFDIGQGGQLPPGQYPLTFIATVDGMTSRSASKDQWAEGDTIGVRIGSYPLIGNYMLHTDGTVMNALVPLEWQNRQSATVKAWYPLESQTNTSLIDQTGGIERYDFLYAEEADQNVAKRVDLKFKHQMAKVSVKLLQGDGFSDEEWSKLKLRIAGTTSVSFSEGLITGNGHDWLTPFYNSELSDYEVLLVPKDMPAEGLIKIDLTVNINGMEIAKQFIYKPDVAELKAGNHYKYNITVKKDRVDVEPVNATWYDQTVPNVAKPRRVNLKNKDWDYQSLTFSENVTAMKADNTVADFKNGDSISYLNVRGPRFTATFKIHDGNQKYSVVSTDTSKIVSQRIYGKEWNDAIQKYEDIYTFDCTIKNYESEVKYVENAEVGDFYYSDGTWGYGQYEGLEIIGIVFHVPQYPQDSGLVTTDGDSYENYDGWEPRRIRGYVMALYDVLKPAAENTDWTSAASATGKWGKNTNTIPDYVTRNWEETNFCGYLYTKQFKVEADWNEA